MDARARSPRAERASVAPASGDARSRVPSRAGHRVAGADAPQRLLIPIDATERSRWGVRYALGRRHDPLHVDLLFVAERVTSLEVLRFRTHAEVAAFQAQSAQYLLEDAAQPLQAAGMSVTAHFREGEVASRIVETAEELGAHAIVMPPPHPLWLDFLTRGIVRKVLRRSRATPVLTVDGEGHAVDRYGVLAAAR